jgi:signal recognition particle subunit SRP54
VFETLSDRLTQVFSALRGRGRLSAADIDATCREIRIALLEADVALPVVRSFISRVRERASTEEVSAALNPAQQVIKIVNDELIKILGGETRRLRFAKTPPTVILLAGLQGSGKTTLAGKLARWLREQGNTPLLVAADLQRPKSRSTRRSPATGWATRSRSPATRWTRPATACTTSSSSTPRAAWVSTRR